MKKFDMLIVTACILYLVLAASCYVMLQGQDTGEHMGYKVEMNRIMQGLERENTFSKPDLRGMNEIKDVQFLSIETRSKQDIQSFYRNHNGVNTAVQPLFLQEQLVGYVRFDYIQSAAGHSGLWLLEGILLAVWLLVITGLWYIRQNILKPFHVISEMPYELSRGNLQSEPEESKSRYFGKFVWGIAMLRDNLDAAKRRELKLEKEKKLLLLSISHDTKIPLNAIKLYTKALKEQVYGTREEELHAVEQIAHQAQQIEESIKEIMSTASEDILAIEVADSEFYLKEYIDRVRKYYEPKCKLVMTDLTIGTYENRLLQGDIDRALEAMENLMENAFKYGDGRRIAIRFHEEDYCQVIEVVNTGAVVAEEEMPHLFDSFYRAANASGKEGNGLGLYIDRQIMRKMGGEIYARRTEDGMCFGLVFPIL